MQKTQEIPMTMGTDFLLAEPRSMTEYTEILPVKRKQQAQLLPQHLLTGEELSAEDIIKILFKALLLKKDHSQKKFQHELAGYNLALLFDKPSLRTRFSFTVAMHQLGGHVVESVGNTRKVETPADQARVLAGYCDAIMVRTFADSHLTAMSKVSTVPIINGLSDLHHPCQILADLLTMFECFGSLQGLTLCYLGDGNNILHSLLLLAPQLGVTIHYCCPTTRAPNEEIVQRSLARIQHATQAMGKIHVFATPEQAVAQANVVYTDVWSSMGFEAQAADHLFDGFQVNEKLMQKAKTGAVFMHCLPMERGKEVSDTLPDSACSVIFQQSENRLHLQKALLLFLLQRGF